MGIGHPCYGCNEQGVGFTKGISQLANVENPTPRNAKPEVMNPEGGQVNLTTVGLLGGVVGLAGGVSLMTVRELGRQQKTLHEDDCRASRKE